MANLLLEPGRWRNGALISPPTEWNGTSYAFTSEIGFTGAFYLDYIGAAPAPGDTFGGSLLFSNEDSLPGFLLLVNPGVSVLGSVPLTSGQTAEFEFEAFAGSRLIIANSDVENSSPTSYYGINAIATPASVAASACQELGRVTRAYVSGYDRARVHIGTVRRQERRCIVANFNGAIQPERSIASVVWRCTSPWVTYMRDPSIFERDAQVMVDFQNPGWGALKATVTLDNGEIYNQTFEYTVRDAPWFMENYAPIAGPYTVTATAS